MLPNAFPYSPAVSGDPCSKKLGGGSFTRPHDQVLRPRAEGQEDDAQGLRACTTSPPRATPAPRPRRSRRTRASPSVRRASSSSPETAGAPVGFEVAKGPIRVAGTPYLDGTMYALGANNRAFYGLAVGMTPADATLIQGNVLPVNELLPVAGEKRSIELPSVAIDVPAGQSLFLMVSPVSEMFARHGQPHAGRHRSDRRRRPPPRRQVAPSASAVPASPWCRAG